MRALMSFLAERIRPDFPVLSQRKEGNLLLYFDSAATTQKPKVVIDAMSRFYAEEYATVHRAVYQLSQKATERYFAVREMVRAFLNAAHYEEIIFTKGATEAINLVAHSFGKAFVQSGDEILISEIEHHANIVPWQRLCEEKGARLVVIPVNERAELDMEAFQRLLSPKTRLVALTHISNSTGTLNPVEEVIRLAHAQGAYVLIDGAQSAAHLTIDVRKMDADFFVFSGHKAFGPTGIGILYGKLNLLEKMPPYQCGGDMIETVTFTETRFQPPPLKFEAGTPLIAQAMGLGVALAYIESLGREKIAAYEQELLAYATDKLLEIEGVRLIGTAEQKGPILTFVVQGVHPLDIGTALDLKRIAVRTGNLCAQPTLQLFGVTSAVRISFAPYNTFQEIDLLMEALRDTLPRLKR